MFILRGVRQIIVQFGCMGCEGGRFLKGIPLKRENELFYRFDEVSDFGWGEGYEKKRYYNLHN